MDHSENLERQDTDANKPKCNWLAIILKTIGLGLLLSVFLLDIAALRQSGQPAFSQGETAAISVLFALAAFLAFFRWKRPALKAWISVPIDVAAELDLVILSYTLVKTFVRGENQNVNLWTDILPLALSWLVCMGVRSLTGRAWAGLLACQLPLFVLSVVENLKLQTRGDVFIPSDIFAAKAAATIVSDTGIALTLGSGIILTLFAFAAMDLAAAKIILPQIRDWRVRIAGGIAAILAAVLSFPFFFPDHKLLGERFRVSNVVWMPSENV